MSADGEATREQLADAWDQGFTAGRPVEYAGVPRPRRDDNPYRDPR